MPTAVRDRWGHDRDGREIERYTLTGDDGVRLRVATIGAALVSLEVPGASGEPVPVVLGYDGLVPYLRNPGYVGSVVGPFANRIRDGRFPLDGRIVEVDRNGAHHLHGGSASFAHRVWEGELLDTDDGPAVRLTLVSPDGAGGFPGPIRAQTVYRLRPGGIGIDWAVETDAPTHVSLTHHAYWNPGGGGSVLDDRLTVPASRVLETDGDRVPTGRTLEVEGTPFDLRTPVRLGDRLPDATGRLHANDGYDHCFVIDGWDGTLREVARMESARTGLAMTMRSTLPGLQIYSAGGLGGMRDTGPGAEDWVDYGALCLEPQFFPDAPNHPGFPSTRLDPGEVWSHRLQVEFERI